MDIMIERQLSARAFKTNQQGNHRRQNPVDGYLYPILHQSYCMPKVTIGGNDKLPAPAYILKCCEPRVHRMIGSKHNRLYSSEPSSICYSQIIIMMFCGMFWLFAYERSSISEAFTMQITSFLNDSAPSTIKTETIPRICSMPFIPVLRRQ